MVNYGKHWQAMANCHKQWEIFSRVHYAALDDNVSTHQGTLNKELLRIYHNIAPVSEVVLVGIPNILGTRSNR